MSNHNTILKLKGLQEWVTLTEGTGIHLTGERSKAYMWTKEDAETIARHWGKRYTTPLQAVTIKIHSAKNKEHAPERLSTYTNNR